MTEDRLVWHQRAHELAHEECSFFIFRFRSSSPSEVESLLTEILSEHSIESFCLYMLFGHYDAMLRVWARADIRRRLVAAFKELPAEIQALREMRVDSVYYGDHEADVSAQFLDSEWSAIMEITRSDHEGRLEGDLALHPKVDFLVEQSAIFVASALSGDQMKVYFAIDYAPGIDVDVSRTLRDIRSAFTRFSPVAVYVGEGFGRFLVKGVAPSFSVLSSSLPSLVDKLAQEHLRCETFLVLGRNAPEADTLDSILHASSSPSVARMLRAGGSKLDPYVKLRTQDELEEVAGQFNEHGFALFTDHELSALAVDIVAAVLKDDAWAISASLYYLSELEYLTREYLRRRALPQAFSSSWLDEVSKALEEAVSTGKSGFRSVREIRDPGGWTLGHCVEIARTSMRLSATFQSIVTTDLGTDSIKLLEDAAQQRNLVAHGRIYGTETEQAQGHHIAFGKYARLRLGTLLASLQLLGRLRRMLKTTQ